MTHVDDVVCHRCKDGGREELLIECDAGCQRWYHIYCMNPRLDAVPGETEVWVCPDCKVVDGFAKRGDIVFAKFFQYPWWPARILDCDSECVINNQVPREGSAWEQDVECEFLGQGTKANIDACRVVSFMNGLATLQHWKNANVGSNDSKLTQAEYNQALGEALDMAAKRRAAIKQVDEETARTAILQAQNRVPPAEPQQQQQQRVFPPQQQQQQQQNDDDDDTDEWIYAMLGANISDEVIRLVLCKKLRCEGSRAAHLLTRCKDMRSPRPKKQLTPQRLPHTPRTKSTKRSRTKTGD